MRQATNGKKLPEVVYLVEQPGMRNSQQQQDLIITRGNQKDPKEDTQGVNKGITNAQ